MIPIPNQLVLNGINKHKLEIDSIITQTRNKLRAHIDDGDWSFNTVQKRYLEDLYKDLNKIVLALPSEIKQFENTFKKLPDSWRKKQYNNPKSFKDKLLQVLDYDGLRRDLYPKYFSGLGIKACVYCNSQLTITTEKLNGSNSVFKGKFQVDHYRSKADYPCFSISFFNLYPTCASCNNAKGMKPLDFELYSNDNVSKSDLSFFIAEDLISDFLVNRNADKLEISFEEPGKKINKEGQFQRLFDIKGIYNTQKDLAEELILKSEVYSEEYKQQLITDFPNIFNSVGLSNRLIIGNYHEEQDIHRRPMAKFTRDIAKQLGLIDE